MNYRQAVERLGLAAQIASMPRVPYGVRAALRDFASAPTMEEIAIALESHDGIGSGAEAAAVVRAMYRKTLTVET